MEEYLKNLLNESDSVIMHIVDDNFDSSMSSLSEALEIVNGRRSARRTNSLNSAVVVDNATNNDDRTYFANDGFPEDSHSRRERGQRLPANKNTNNNTNRVELSARMEVHRQTRWEASTSSSQQSKPPVRSGSNTTALRNSLDLRMIPDLTREKTQREATTTTRQYIDDHAIEHWKAITATRDNIDDHASIYDRKRISSSSLSNQFLNDCASASHQLVMNKALAISVVVPACTTTRTTKNGSTSQQVKWDFPSKLESMSSLPLVPIRRRSIDIYELEFPLSAKFEVPILLRELPYHMCSDSI